MQTKNTRKITERRPLTFSRLQDLVDDALSFGVEPRTSGNWSAAQIVEHVTTLIDFSVDGFPIKGTLPLRVMGFLVKRSSLRKTLPAGFKIPFPVLDPEDRPWPEAIAHLRETVARAGKDRMTARSPLLGALTHDEWEQLHCHHAELHFSFMQPAAGN